ncbi:MAG: hypothetical protein HND54_03055 [Bacteroidetes bacterium]|nr:hypothetical protein [Bacteroidota bacterium]NOG56697.1 hypothetical protein [Bacteroidota bacterium]
MTGNEISKKIIGAANEVLKQLGPGLLKFYEICSANKLKTRCLSTPVT